MSMKWPRLFSRKQKDAFAGKYFLCMSCCESCGASRVDGMGRVLERVDCGGCLFYAIEPFAIGTLDRANFTRLVTGHEMAQWSFYDSVGTLLDDCRDVQRSHHRHELSAQVN